MATSRHDAMQNAESSAQLDSDTYVSRKAMANAPQSDRSGSANATNCVSKHSALSSARTAAHGDPEIRTRRATPGARAAKPQATRNDSRADRSSPGKSRPPRPISSSTSGKTASERVRRDAAPLHQKSAHKNKSRLRIWFESLPLDESDAVLPDQTDVVKEEFHSTSLSDFMDPVKPRRSLFSKNAHNDSDSDYYDYSGETAQSGREYVYSESEAREPELPDYVDDPSPTIIRDGKSRRKPAPKRKDTESRESSRPSKAEPERQPRTAPVRADANVKQNLRVDVQRAASADVGVANALKVDLPQQGGSLDAFSANTGAESTVERDVYAQHPETKRDMPGIPRPRPISGEPEPIEPVRPLSQIVLPVPQPIEPNDTLGDNAELERARQTARQAMDATDGSGVSAYVDADDSPDATPDVSDSLAYQANALISQWQTRFNEKVEGNLEPYRMQNVRRAVESVLGSCESYSELESRWNDICAVMDKYSAPVVLEHRYLEMNRRLLELRVNSRTPDSNPTSTANMIQLIQPPEPSHTQYTYDADAESVDQPGYAGADYDGDESYGASTYADLDFDGDSDADPSSVNPAENPGTADSAPTRTPAGARTGQSAQRPPSYVRSPAPDDFNGDISDEINDPDSLFDDDEDMEDYVPDRPYRAPNRNDICAILKKLKQLADKAGTLFIMLILLAISFIAFIVEKVGGVFSRKNDPEVFTESDSEYIYGWPEDQFENGKPATRAQNPNSNDADYQQHYVRAQSGGHAAVSDASPVYVAKAAHDRRERAGKYARGASSASAHRIKSGKPHSSLILKLALFALVGCMIFGGYVGLKLLIDVKQYESTFYPGIYLDGYELVGQTVDSAYSQLAAVNQYRIDNANLTLTYGEKSWAIDNRQLNVQLNLQEVVKDCWEQGRSGNAFERQEEIVALRSAPYVRFSSISYDTATLRSFIDAIKAEIDRPSVDATISFDPNAGANQKFEITDDVIGREIDANELFAECDAAIRSGEAAVIAISPKLSEPRLKASDLSLATNKLVSYSTELSKNKNRTANVKLALSKYNGLVVLPGEQVDFNKLVGPRTKEAGFNPAPEYSGTDVVEGIGGGICQASTTLYGALLRAGMQIDYRANHNMTVSYVPASQDAAVSYPGKTLTFTNNSDYPIFFDTLVTDEKVSVAIYGYDMYPDVTITVESEIIETDKAGYKTVSDPNYEHVKYAGDYYVEARAYDGIVSRAYRIFTDDATGSIIKKEDLGTDRYRKREGLRYYGGIWNG